MSRRARQPLDDRPVWLVSPEDLILLKLIAQRPRDLANVGDVLFMQGQLDESYLRRWVQLGRRSPIAGSVLRRDA